MQLLPFADTWASVLAFPQALLSMIQSVQKLLHMKLIPTFWLRTPTQFSSTKTFLDAFLHFLYALPVSIENKNIIFTIIIIPKITVLLDNDLLNLYWHSCNKNFTELIKTSLRNMSQSINYLLLSTYFIWTWKLSISSRLCTYSCNNQEKRCFSQGSSFI